MILFMKIIIIVIIITTHIVILSSSSSVDKFFKANRFGVITQRVVDALSTCADENGLHFITLLTDSEEKIRLPQHVFDSFSVLEVKIAFSRGNDTKMFSNFSNPDLSKKVQIVLAITSSPSILQSFLTELKNSKLWNILGFYVIIDTETLEKNCERAYEFLQTFWKNKLLKSIFFCINSNDEILIYTYNPYIKWAPKEWQEVSDKSNDSSTHDTWTMYRRKLIKNDTTCSELNFSKDLTVGGHEIKGLAMSVPPTFETDANKTGLAKYKGLDALIITALSTKINATLRVTVIDDTVQSNGYFHSNNAVNHHIAHIMKSGNKDILMNAQYVVNAQYIFNAPKNSSLTYPHMNSGLSMITRFAGYEAGPSKILRFMNPKLIFGTCLVFLVTVLILGILGGEGIISASLEVLRIMIGVSVVRMPQRTPLRLYLITVVMLFLITGSTFQGSLSSVLTSPVPLPNVDSKADLRKASSRIYVFERYRNLLMHNDTRHRLTLTDHWNCTKYVIEQENTVCVAERLRLSKIGFDRNLYVSKHRLTTLYASFVVRPDWPLVGRFSNLLLYMWQCGLIDYWYSISLSAYKPKWLKMQGVKISGDYRSMTVIDLEFAFYILFFGLTTSILVFFIEKLTEKKCRGKPKIGEIELPPFFEYTE